MPNITLGKKKRKEQHNIHALSRQYKPQAGKIYRQGNAIYTENYSISAIKFKDPYLKDACFRP
jgi:hypothetical protein